MRRFTVPFIILTFVISTAGAAPAVLAQTCESGCSLDENAQCVPVGNRTQACKPPSTAGAAADLSAIAPLQAQINANADAASAGIPLPFQAGGVFASVMTFLMTIFAWLLGVAMVTLDYAVLYTVVKMGSYINNLPAIGVAWSILRDIGNITLIFGFLAVGITTILNVDWYGDRKKFLPMLLVAAVFLNFSLFISEAVIDTGNLFATQFYTQINGGVAAGNKSSISNETISSKIMSQLGLQTLYGAALDSEKSKELFKADNIGLIGIMGILLFIVAAFVIFSLAFILIARFVALIFLIILAPIGFAGLAIPQLAPTANKWWKALFDQTITAPILLLLLYIALLVITNDSFLFDSLGGAKPDYLGFIQDPRGTFNLPGFARILISFLVAMGLLAAVSIFSKKLSAFGAGWAMKSAGKLSFGATAFVGRRTVGRVSNFAARKIRSSSLGRSETGRLLAGVADRGAKASFDIRGATTLGGLKAAGIEAGEAQKGGYRGREEELVKARTEYAKGLVQSQEQKNATAQAKTMKEQLETEHDKNIAALGVEEQTQLKTSQKIIDASREELKLKQQELEAARKFGNADQIRNAETAYNNNARIHDDLKDKEREKLDPIRKKIETEKNRFGAAIAAQDIIIKNNSTEKNQEQYGKALQEKSFLGIPRAPYDWTTAVGSARREAAGKIISDSQKDKSQKKLDQLEAILGKADEKIKADSGSEEKSK